VGSVVDPPVPVLDEGSGRVGWSDAVIGGPVGASDAVEGPDDGVPVELELSDGVVVGSPVGDALGEVVGAVVGVVSEAQKVSTDPDTAWVSAVNTGPDVGICCWRQSAHRSATGRAGVVTTDDVPGAGFGCCTRGAVEVVVTAAATDSLGDGVAVGDGVVRSGIGAPIVRCATSCNGAGSRPV
jgi:hypothetical protein